MRGFSLHRTIGELWLALVVVLAWNSPASAQAGEERILTEASVSGSKLCSTVTIRFNGPIRYHGASPLDPASQLRLRVDPLRSRRAMPVESLPPPPSAPLLRSIQFEADAPGGPALILGLEQRTRHDVALGHDAQSIVLMLEDTSSPAACSGEMGADAPARLESAQLQSLQLRAEQAILRGDYDTAAASLDRILGAGENPHTPRALELSGVTHERRDELVVARARYKEYLDRYPGHDGARRIRQRLAAVAAPAQADGPSVAGEAPLREFRSRGWKVDVSGVFSQFYSRDTSRNVFLDARRVDPIEEIDRRVNVDQLLSSGDVSVSASNGRTSLQARAAGSYTADFRPVTLVGSSRNSGGDTERISALYFDVRDEGTGLSGRLGRQSLFGAGVFGRFDGVRLGWQASQAVKVNVQAGYPVFTTRNTHVDRSRNFYGFSVGYAPPTRHFGVTGYFFDQRSEGLADRRSIGVEARYTSSAFATFGLVDYDFALDRLAHAYLTLSVPLPGDANLSVQADHQYYPPLSLTNAVIGQPVPRLEAVKALFDRPALRQLARDRSAATQSLTVNYSKPLSGRWLVNLDVALSRTSGLPASGGVAAIAGTGTEVYSGVQLVGNGIVRPGDSLLAGIRYADVHRFRILAAEMAARFPIGPRLGVEPRLRLARRTDKFGPGHQTAIQPTVRATYDASRRVALDAEIGFNFLRQRQSDAAFFGRNRERATILNIGYRLSF